VRSRDLLLAAVMLACAVVHAQPAASAPVVDVPSASASATTSAAGPGVMPVPVKVAASAIDAEAVWIAEGEVRADPLWAGEEKKKVLRFKKSKDEAPEKKLEKPEDFRWWVEMFKNLSAGLRVALWLIGAAALVWVLLRLRDWLKGQEGGSALKGAPPTHVGSLDIRPESLPDDIGAAARALWQRGEQRAALSLLYRGALSRLVHGHGVPIRSASTERVCLVLAAARVSPAALDFLSRLVSGWQTVAYAQRELAADRFEALCADFDARMAVGPVNGGTGVTAGGTAVVSNGGAA
jgi:hypothetical protein